MSVFSSKKLKPLLEPLIKNNPITVQVLGVCSALAVTVKLETAMVMAIALVIVTGVSNLVISCIRNFIPHSIRMIVQLVIISAIVIPIDQVLKAYAFEVSKQLSVFVGLIICNCIVMGRLEAYAMAHKPLPSLLDGVGTGAGYGLLLVFVAFIRELLGSGTLYGHQIVPQAFYDFGYHNNNLVILPPMAIIILGVIIWVQRACTKELAK